MQVLVVLTPQLRGLIKLCLDLLGIYAYFFIEITFILKIGLVI